MKTPKKGINLGLNKQQAPKKNRIYLGKNKNTKMSNTSEENLNLGLYKQQAPKENLIYV